MQITTSQPTSGTATVVADRKVAGFVVVCIGQDGKLRHAEACPSDVAVRHFLDAEHCCVLNHRVVEVTV